MNVYIEHSRHPTKPIVKIPMFWSSYDPRNFIVNEISFIESTTNNLGGFLKIAQEFLDNP